MNAKSGKAATYHHGRLREALLTEALQVLREQGAERLSLRALARTLGVSQTAPYRHFADKESLLAELATAGFQELSRAMQAAMERSAPAPGSALQAAGISYVVFAVEHPEQYRLMFGTYRVDKKRYAALVDASRDARGVLLGVIERGLDSRAFRREPAEILALAAWSIVHGLASLGIDGQLSGTGEEPNVEALADQVTRLLVTGIRLERRTPERRKPRH